MHRRFLALALAGATVAASAQILGAPPGTPEQRPLPDTPEWKELDAPPPPALRTSGLIPIDVPGTSLHFGVDPASVTVGKDRIVRYVVVATSNSGAVNGMYEGIRCDAGEVKVYARHNPDSGWVPVPDASWVPLHSTPNTRYSLIIARSGVCFNNSANGSAAQIVRDLRSPVDRRFERGGVNQ
jgi:hypothetical protein